MMRKTILFVSHKPKQCGVYEFGRNIFNAISLSKKYHFIRAECESFEELERAVVNHRPEAIIYNYHPSVMPWLCTKLCKGVYLNNISGINAIQIGIVHEITQEVADSATAYRNKFILGGSQKKINSLFDFYVASDPTLLLKNPFVFKTGRLISQYEGIVKQPAVTTVGSFGFATPKKGFTSLVEKVQEEFDEAIIRINMPAASFGDPKGENARRIAAECRSLVNKPKIKVEISHEYLNNDQLLDFLAGNSMNVFMYEDKNGRGISSAVDNALAVKRPIAVSNSPMFRHILNVQPSVCTSELPLRKILENGFAPLQQLINGWDLENIIWDYDRILDASFFKFSNKVKPALGIIRTLKAKRNRLLTLPEISFTWLRNTEAATDDNLSPDISEKYTSVVIPDGIGLNRILDDDARELYKPAVEKLFQLAPSTMSKKISRANVQQAFVFDTVFRYLKDYSNPSMLCVGSYEDTASLALQKMGFKVDEVDPMINYYLQEFYTKPTTVKDSYNIIFSTSVIEHDPDDKSFIECVENLLAVNGVAVITCDYKDGWKPGQPKPDVDERFYTKNDLEKRLMSYLKSSELVDKPDWECAAPDFNYLGKYQYSFATFVFRKIK